MHCFFLHLDPRRSSISPVTYVYTTTEKHRTTLSDLCPPFRPIGRDPSGLSLGEKKEKVRLFFLPRFPPCPDTYCYCSTARYLAAQPTDFCVLYGTKCQLCSRQGAKRNTHSQSTEEDDFFALRKLLPSFLQHQYCAISAPFPQSVLSEQQRVMYCARTKLTFRLADLPPSKYLVFS